MERNLFSTISHKEDNLEKFALQVIFVHFSEISVQFKFDLSICRMVLF